MRHAMIPKYILTPILGLLPQIIYKCALGSTLLEMKPEVKVTLTWNQLVTRQGQKMYSRSVHTLKWGLKCLEMTVQLCEYSTKYLQNFHGSSKKIFQFSDLPPTPSPNPPPPPKKKKK